ncbi:MAG: hypothetical protein IPO01_13525 [Chitinophagaceae bacterium]|nr:hypothetical protein [Chitinophagaceae bacterium]
MAEPTKQFTEKKDWEIMTFYTLLEDIIQKNWFGTAGGGVSKYNATKFRYETE